MQCCLRHLVGQLQLQLHLPVDDEGVGQIRSETRLIIIVAVVAQQGTDALALGIEVADVEGVALLEMALTGRRPYQAVSLSRKTDHADGVEGIEAAGTDFI